MSTFLGGSEVSGMYLGSNEISEMYLGSNLIYSSSRWPYETLRISTDGGITWEDHGRPVELESSQFFNKRITHVELPDSITTLPSEVFRGNKIKNIQLPDSIVSIEYSAFSENEIDTLYIPDSVKIIGNRVFWSNSLTYVEFPETLESIGSTAFQYNQLTYVEFPETLDSIGDMAFRDNPSLTEVRISSRTAYRKGSDSTFDSHTNIITYDPEPSSGFIMGVEWDKQADPTMTRIGGSKDFVANIGIGDEVVRNDFDNAPIYREITRETDGLGNTFVRIPKFYIRKTDDEGLLRLEISKTQIPGSYLPKCFWDFTNSKELPYVDVGAYITSWSYEWDRVESRSGVAPEAWMSIKEHRDYARANGPGYQQLDIHAVDMLQCLFRVEFATLDSQSIHPGYTGGNEAKITGGTDGVAASSGSMGTSSSYQFMYRGIEDLWGNVWQHVDGVNISNRQAWVCENAAQYASDVFAAPYQKLSYVNASSDGYTKEMGFDPNRPYAQFPIAVGAGTTTYYSDNYWQATGQRAAMFGGDWQYGEDTGLSCWGLSDDSKTAYNALGGRLLRKPL